MTASEVVFIRSSGGGGLAQGQPIFFLRTERRVILLQAPTAFLNDKYVRNVKRTPSAHTWAAAAQAMKSWLTFLQALPKFKSCGDDPNLWQRATREDRKFYRECYQNYSNNAGDEFSLQTIVNRMTVIMNFYVWATNRGAYVGDMLTALSSTDSWQPAIDEDPLAHTRSFERRTTAEDDDLPKTPYSTPTKVNPLEPAAVATLLNILGPSPAPENRDPRPSRNRVFADLILDTGIRIQEALDLTIHQFLQFTTDPNNPFDTYPLTINRGKGRKKRIVNVHAWIIEDVQKYIFGERHASLRAGRISPRAASNKIWLNHATHRLAGKPTTKGALQKMFAEACFKTGLTTKLLVLDEETGEHVTVHSASHSVHDLRHTFAVRYSESQWLLGNTEPWLSLSRLLGHANPATTKHHYLRFVDLISTKHVTFVTKNQREIGK